MPPERKLRSGLGQHGNAIHNYYHVNVCANTFFLGCTIEAVSLKSTIHQRESAHPFRFNTARTWKHVQINISQQNLSRPNQPVLRSWWDPSKPLSPRLVMQLRFPNVQATRLAPTYPQTGQHMP
ncbi:hypothetical protein COCSADRAFT_195547 [Bipolaris sorokiniana ND90Pr]|uniref:Uncharacterized protein n=1 Tax=Cochliobolus sativus (strain ND90Pr / ATCC 201652) TaxID=665912 RepID=M2SRA2_COCSN|nr:uncharacterized protein COCSADRAFT_195547 [Bipolaris sorokiniana ND90Pr]EMD69788.1 hypothetical protein COCSADRAFT_195547 [Bipolaris sorokiniana ND90Pr]